MALTDSSASRRGRATAGMSSSMAGGRPPWLPLRGAVQGNQGPFVDELTLDLHHGSEADEQHLAGALRVVHAGQRAVDSRRWSRSAKSCAEVMSSWQ